MKYKKKRIFRVHSDKKKEINRRSSYPASQKVRVRDFGFLRL